MNVCIHDSYNVVVRCMLQIGESTIHRILVPWLLFMEASFSRLNLKLDDGVLPYSMLEVFNKTGHGPTDIIIAWAEFKPVLYQEVFGQEWCVHLLSTKLELKAFCHDWGLCQNLFRIQYLVRVSNLGNHHRILHTRISLGAKFQLQQFLFFGSNLPKKGCFRLKTEKMSIMVESFKLDLV